MQIESLLQSQHHYTTATIILQVDTGIIVTKFQYLFWIFCHMATPCNSARSLRQDFCLNSKFRRWRNTVCIPHLRNCRSGAKKTAETRRCNCAVLPYEKHRRFSAAVFLRLVEAVKGQTGYVLAEFPDGIRQAALDLGHVMDVGAFDELALHPGQIP